MNYWLSPRNSAYLPTLVLARAARLCLHCAVEVVVVSKAKAGTKGLRNSSL